MQAKTKIGPHLLRGGNQDATLWIEHGRPAVAKLVNCGLPGEYLRRSDWCRWAGRVYENIFDPNNPSGGGWSTDPAQAARAYVDNILRSSIIGNPHIRYWEMNNEPVIKSLERMRWLALFCAEGCRVLRTEYGVGGVVGNFSVGEPGDPKDDDLSLWAAWGPALKAIQDYDGMMGLHRYGPLNELYALRYRVDQRAFAALGYPNTSIFIGECGAEGISKDGRVVMRTWREEFGTPERYAAYLLDFNAELMKDPYVIGATVYTYGGDGWDNHNINDSGVGRIMGDTSRDRPWFTVGDAVETTPLPEPPPTPLPIPTGQPRVQYARTYVLLPPTANLSMAQAALRRYFGDRYTVGFSADDAGIGALADRTVIAVDPEGWGADLQSWFRQYYPGINYKTQRSSDL